ncbi:hypothetical protein LTR53_008930 [Teratosphaeriaceae sp. CCFEE 6253]|nr:hypothetical protein LTR53_008930 [Teratosphaeriaceae sp. CCFEE 6253]
MHLRHVALQRYRQLARRYPVLRRLSIVTTFLTLLWTYALFWGERTTFARHIDACAWDKWEQWPSDATPHRLVFVADPQLVDPHTYPGRPWPLSSLTETYTDLYMGRNFRLINAEFDPDSIVFLGDLFDGGREWATNRAVPLKSPIIQSLKATGARPKHDGSKKGQQDTGFEQVEKDGRKLFVIGNDGEQKGHEKRSMDSYKKAISMPHNHRIDKKDHWLTSDGRDLKEFVHGEDGRWSAWGPSQWATDFARFGRVFFDADQLYPRADRQMHAAFEVATDEVSIENGAHDVTSQQYATSGGKPRRVIASLPGNHDIGFGRLVQLPVRDRFQMLFGETDRIDVIGNHTFVSVDTPSLSATGQFLSEGGETQPEKAVDLEHIWNPTMDFLENIRAPADKAVSGALQRYYPDQIVQRGHDHVVADTRDAAEPVLARDAIEKPSTAALELPVILLTHVPLYRDPDTNCGRLRERGPSIRVAAGYQYQNVITKALSNALINYVSAAGDIAHIFSGDDHDYCDVSHRYNVVPGGQTSKAGSTIKSSRLSNVREITVKSFSWAMGVRRPGFQLVSLWNPVDAKGKTVGTPLPTVQSRLCLLPDQLSIFIDYALVLGVTLTVLLLRAIAVGLRYDPDAADEESEPDSPAAGLVLPRFQPSANGAANGFTVPKSNGSAAKGRHRASSSSVSNKNGNSNAALGVQRSYHARTRSVSPALGAYTPDHISKAPFTSSEHNGPLIEKAGYYPQVRWADPADEDSDEESHIGDVDAADDDSQAKWKRRRRTPGKARKAVEEFFVSLLVVGAPVMGWYIWLLRHG